ncbi:MAG: ABC transporter permease [Gaiellaceae bacterium]
MRAAALALRASFRFHLKATLKSTSTVLYLILIPIVYATIAFFMYRAGAADEAVLWIALAAGLMGLWSTTLAGSGMALQRERWSGTLELLFSAPPPFAAVLLGVALATSAAGLYSLVATLVWGVLFFDVPLDVAHPLLFAISLPTTVLVLGLFGLVLAATFILYRQTFALVNLFEYPLWLITGLLVPVSLLPGWVEPFAWAIGPTWGIKAVHQAATGGDPLPELAAALVLGVVYVGIGALCLRYFERLARERATLALT